MMRHPPKPRFTLRVGITGHRPNKLPSSAIARTMGQLRQMFEAIEAAARRIYEANRRDNDFAFVEDRQAVRHPPDLRVRRGGRPDGGRRLSGRLDGRSRRCRSRRKNTSRTSSSRLPVTATTCATSFLISLARASVVTDIAYATKRARVPTATLRPAVSCCDRSTSWVAVWDGEAPKPGGTGAIAKEAHEGGIPVVWLYRRWRDRTPRLIEAFDESNKPVVEKADTDEAAVFRVLAPYPCRAIRRPWVDAGASRFFLWGRHGDR